MVPVGRAQIAVNPEKQQTTTCKVGTLLPDDVSAAVCAARGVSSASARAHEGVRRVMLSRPCLSWHCTQLVRWRLVTLTGTILRSLLSKNF